MSVRSSTERAMSARQEQQTTKGLHCSCKASRMRGKIQASERAALRITDLYLHCSLWAYYYQASSFALVRKHGGQWKWRVNAEWVAIDDGVTGTGYNELATLSLAASPTVYVGSSAAARFAITRPSSISNVRAYLSVAGNAGKGSAMQQRAEWPRHRLGGRCSPSDAMADAVRIWQASYATMHIAVSKCKI
eukprot:6190185-Pleurochrysis_carterae.AAC.3